MRTGLTIATLLAFAVPCAPAGAAAVRDNPDDPGRIVFVAAPGEVNDLRVTREGADIVFDDDVAVADESTRCVPGADASVRCAFVTAEVSRTFERFVVALGDRDDEVALTDVYLPAFLLGDDGNDTLRAPRRSTPEQLIGGATLEGGAGDDVLEAVDALTWTMRGGDGADVLRGSTRVLTAREESFAPATNGTMTGGPGPDRFEGGVSRDFVSYNDRTAPVTATLDDVADDGAPGEGDDVRVSVDGILGTDGADRLVASPEGEFVSGFDGDDELVGGDGEDRIVGGGGDDALEGRGGRDELLGLEGADRLSGGDGLDEAIFLSRATPDPAVSVTLDGLAGDGTPGEGDTVLGDVEDVSTDAAGDTIRGDAGPNVLSGGSGADRLDGAGGADRILAGSGDDVVEARDGTADRVVCGEGSDRAVLDAADETVGCEVEERAARPATQEAQATAQSGATPAQSKPADGTPRTQGPAARRAPAGLSLAVTPRRDRRAPYRFIATGTLRRPTGIAADGCSGTVTVQVKRGGRTLSTRRVALTPACRFRSTVTFRDARRLGRRGTLRFVARFAGNALLAPAASRGVARRVR